MKVTNKQRDQINTLMNSKHVGARHLTAHRRDRPTGLQHYTIDNIRFGRTKTARKDHLQWIVQAAEEYAPKAKMTDKRLRRLKDLFREKNAGPALVLAQKPVPSGFKRHTIVNVMTANTKTIKRNYLSWMFNTLRRLPVQSAAAAGTDAARCTVQMEPTLLST